MSIFQSTLRKAIGATFLATVLGKCAFLVMNALLGRMLGPESFGLFVFASGTAVLAARFSALGWPTMSMRYLPAFVADQDWGRYRGILGAAFKVVSLATLICSLLLLLAGFWVQQGSDRQDLAWGLYLSALVLPGIALRRMLRQVLAAMRKPGHSVIVDEVIPPVLVIAGILVISVNAVSATIGYAIASAMAIFVGGVLTVRHVAMHIPQAADIVEFRLWFGKAFQFLIGVSSRMLLNRTDVILLAPLATLAETGTYGAAMRLTYILTFPQIVLSMVMNPRYSDAYSRKNYAALAKHMRFSYIFSVSTALVLSLPLILFPDRIMTLVYGSAFGGGGRVLFLLSLSQLIAGIALPSVSVAMMTDRQNMVSVSTLAAVFVNVGLNIWLIPLYGAQGAATASLVTMLGLAAFQIPWVALSLRRDLSAAKSKDP